MVGSLFLAVDRLFLAVDYGYDLVYRINSDISFCRDVEHERLAELEAEDSRLNQLRDVPNRPNADVGEPEVQSFIPLVIVSIQSDLVWDSVFLRIWLSLNFF